MKRSPLRSIQLVREFFGMSRVDCKRVGFAVRVNDLHFVDVDVVIENAAGESLQTFRLRCRFE